MQNQLENELDKRLYRSTKVLKILVVISSGLVLLNLLHGLFSPKTFFSLTGEGVLLIEIGILIWGLIIGSLLGLIKYENLTYKMRFMFWFLIFICLQNIFCIFINCTEYL
jgi:hypothetical protein